MAVTVDDTDDDVVIVHVSGEGPRGPSGTSDKNQVFTQAVASALWVVTHNLGKFPSVTVFDSAKTQIEGDVTHVNANELTIAFGGAFSGVAYLN